MIEPVIKQKVLLGVHTFKSIAILSVVSEDMCATVTVQNHLIFLLYD